MSAADPSGDSVHERGERAERTVIRCGSSAAGGCAAGTRHRQQRHFRERSAGSCRSTVNAADDVHPGVAGTFLTANVLYATLKRTQLPAHDLRLREDEYGEPSRYLHLDPELASYLRQVAHRVASESRSHDD